MVRKRSYFIVTLGCAKNEFDSSLLEKRFQEEGYVKADSIESADFVLLNTCAFIEDAVKETLTTAYEIKSMLKKGQKFIFGGCAVNYFREKIREAVYADYYLSTAALLNTTDILKNNDEGGLFLEWDENDFDCSTYKTSQESRPYAYLKIAEGCSNNCSYCLIPRIRGSLKSITSDAIIEEALRLVQTGVKEINLISQDLASYGRDRNSDITIYDLVNKLSESLENEQIWIRLLYLNPDNIDFHRLFNLLSNEKVVPYLEMPVQSGSKRVLKLMNRKRAPEDILEGIGMLRERIKNLSLRTTFLVGFPGEEEKDFEETVDFLYKLRPDYAVVFGYSDMEGTAAFRAKDKLSRRIIIDRLNYLSEIVYKIMEEKAAEKEGSVVKMLVESSDGRTSTGRAYFQAPEVDGLISLEADLKPGTFAQVRLKTSSGVDFLGELV
ncbi:MAG: MiaB/RimO family radical SAM methylthiotransferase [Actinobacteria bacterium]|nr:MiaB/RimO family radical SAM methylthiotransferase [Actinomycetota bacterium]